MWNQTLLRMSTGWLLAACVWLLPFVASAQVNLRFKPNTWKAPSTSIGAGYTVTVEYEVENTGTSKIGLDIIFYYNDSRTTSRATELKKITVAELDGGKSLGLKKESLVLPKHVVFGTRYIIARIVAAGNTQETNTTDNLMYHPITLTGLPDLRVSFVGVSPPAQVPGGPLQVTYRIYNGGRTRANTNFYTRFYLSTNNTYETSDTYLSRSLLTRGLDAITYDPASANGTTTVTLPSNAQPGKVFLLAVVDFDDRVKNEVNNSIAGNTYARAFDLVAQKPDLKMKSFSLNPNSVAGSGTKTTVTFNVENIGTGATSGTHYVSFYYSDSTSTSNLTYLNRYTLPSIAGGKDLGNKTIDLNLPSNSLYGSSRYNRGSARIQITGRPNLAWYSLSITPTSQVAGGQLSVRYGVRNIGATVAAASSLRCWYSTNNTIGSGDSLLQGEVTIPKLNSNQYTSGTAIFTLPATNVIAGSRFVVCRLDSRGQVTETTNNDNDRAAALTVSRAIADLQMTTWAVPTSSPGHNNSIKVDYTISNTGNADAVESVATFYYTDTGTFSTSNVLGTVNIKALKAGENATGSVSLKLPGKVQTGTRYIHYVLDSGNIVGESNESNNQGKKTINITGKPNLVVSVLSVQPTTQIPGGQMTVTYRVENKGETRATTTSYARIYFSTDTTIDTTDVYRGQIYIPGLDAGGSYPSPANGTTTITLPSNAATGTNYIGLLLDYNNGVTESNENDNTKAEKITVGSNIADLSMDSWTLSSSTFQGAGDTVTIKFKIKNGGNANTGAFNVLFGYSDSTSTSALTSLGTANVTGIAAGQTSSDITATVQLPNNVASGKRYIHFYIDSDATIPESSETNNRSYTDIQITGKPNMQVDVLSISPTSQVGYGYVSVTYRVKNVGKVRSTGNYVAFYYSTDATITTQDTYLTRVYVGTLNVGTTLPTLGTNTTTVRVPASAKAGSTEYIGAFADYTNTLSESDENDNTKSAALTVVSTIADLSMYSWSIKPTTVSGYNSAIDIEFRVRNNGTDFASFIKVSFYYSTSSSTTTTQGLQLLGSLTIRRIDARTIDSTQTLTNLKLPRSVVNGQGYIHAFVDPDNTINEQYETNNRSTKPLTITGLPNLQVSVLSVQPTSLGAGGQITVTWRIFNAGLTAASNFKLGVYYSEDATITTQDTLLRTTTVTVLGAQAFQPGSASGTTTVTLPQSANPGTRTIGLYVDYEGKVKETVETDNIKTATIQVSAPQPDLAASSIATTPNAQKTGQSVSITIKLQNLGGADVIGYQAGIYYSQDATVDSSDTLLQNVAMGPVKGGQSITRTVTVTLPTTLTGGQGYIGVFLDNDTKITESSETNNTASAAFTVYTDQDKDGVYSDTDCNDNDKTIYPQAPELCDGKDNDCNKKIDDNPQCVCKSGDVRPCYSGSTGCTKQSNGGYTCTPNSPCKAGTQKCTNGQWESTCNGEALPGQETCNGKDDNCDGQTDENLTQNCYTGPQGTAGQGLCKEGVRTCNGGQWSTCVGEVTPSQESCDGQDNDCDGNTDNQPNTRQSLEQPCTSACGNGVEVCQVGKWVNCSAPQTCEPGKEGASEPTTDGGPDQGIPETDCYTQSCPSGEVCRNGRCILDPCDGVSCQADEFCRNGQCVTACGCTQCNAGESCIDGACINNPCAGVQCPSGEVCDPLSGQCDSDPCQGITCGPGRVCNSGSCADDPCANVKCPLGQVCNMGQCVGQNCQNQEGTTEGTPESADTEGTTESNTDGGSQDSSPDAVTTTEAPTSKEGQTDSTTASDASTGSDNTSTVDKDSTTDTNVNTELPPIPEGGCGCQMNPTAPSSFVFFFALFLVFAFRR